jgi:hypothetical protein
VKYNAKQLDDGTWAVFIGRTKYWPHTISETKKEANLWAIKESAIWHQKQLDKLSDDFGIVEGGSLTEWIN